MLEVLLSSHDRTSSSVAAVNRNIVIKSAPVGDVVVWDYVSMIFTGNWDHAQSLDYRRWSLLRNGFLFDTMKMWKVRKGRIK